MALLDFSASVPRLIFIFLFFWRVASETPATQLSSTTLLLSSLGAVVDRRLLVRRNRGVVAPPRGLLLEVVLRRLHEPGIGQQVEPGESDCLGRNNHSVLADAHSRRSCRLPRVRRTSRHERRRRESNGRHVPADVADVG